MTLRADVYPALVELGTIVLGELPLDELLQRVVELAKRTIDPADEVSMTFTRGNDAWTVVSTGPLATELDERQYESGGGPCMDAGNGGEIVLIRDFRTEERWPEYTPKALECGGGSSLSIPLPVQGEFVAALNIYSRTVDAFSDDHVALAEQFGAHAGVAVLNAHRLESATSLAENLRVAMGSRAVIEQAKGILMARTPCTAEVAFDMLAKASQRQNRKLRDLAQEIVDRATRGT